MTAPLPAPVPEAPCPGGTTVEQCAAMASWASAEAADATARWIELTLYAEVFGGLAAIVAAGFAGAAFVMSRRGAIASEKQADAAGKMLEFEKMRRRDARLADALDRRATLHLPESPRLKVPKTEEEAYCLIPIGTAGPTGVFGLDVSVVLTVLLDNQTITAVEGAFEAEEEVNLQPTEKRLLRIPLSIDREALARHTNTWFGYKLQIFMRWKDGMGLLVVEEWLARGTFIPDNRQHTSERPTIVDYGAEIPPDG